MNETIELIIKNLRDLNVEEAKFRYTYCVEKYGKVLVDQVISERIRVLVETEENVAIELNRLITNMDNEKQISKVLVGIMAIIFGNLGVHWFIVGETNKGVTYLLITLILGPLTCFIATFVMSIIAIIDGIKILSMPGENYKKYD